MDKANLVKALLETRGCRWIPYSNCRSNPSKVQNIFETLEGIWNALPNSRGVVKTNLIKALLENRGCRWISNSNSEVKR